jgi:hypothetical protein
MISTPRGGGSTGSARSAPPADAPGPYRHARGALVLVLGGGAAGAVVGGEADGEDRHPAVHERLGARPTRSGRTNGRGGGPAGTPVRATSAASALSRPTRRPDDRETLP